MSATGKRGALSGVTRAGEMRSTVAAVLKFREFGSVAAGIIRAGPALGVRPKPEETAFDLLAASLHDVRQMVSGSGRFDHALLRRFASYRHSAPAWLEFD